jgi:Flp pilus assembly pilin Flp
MRKYLVELYKDEGGATALEYGLMAASVAGVIIAIAFFAGGRVSRVMNNVAQHLN